MSRCDGRSALGFGGAELGIRPMTIEPQSVVGIVIAGLGGAAVGLERE